MRTGWRREALRNLDDETAFIERDDPQAAQLVARRVLDAVAMLSDQPGIGRPGRVHGIRELIVLKTRYTVPYRVRGETIEIPRVFHYLASPAAARAVALAGRHQCVKLSTQGTWLEIPKRLRGVAPPFLDCPRLARQPSSSGHYLPRI